ncbi:bifunctional hydroxymethylpyrimidine kinase/phosphomethylpyrimidine kinase [Lipingzhangella sp. LS1_29]|uniref:Bifunctional hydroxymethylpyrimidine kinase/phosphomethylpyrimidine kinase n=1 Tax=Lipingzhangella rawalii TaxID=2055835 RepID=A0ABU2H808_9ACTN|nr:bifunctional hydroxymethylpyrimidine kinase/phosphomethylpyrimidine kinase [Lipingzhangella rawalii]MDS1270984.1 bifunctional hydroxymethylpyrimidine kinase/phosphomethylpyrimidine kinase [Lipingzhangella rawalii]
MTYKLLTIAGSDPSGGAGIQADLKTFSALGCYGMAVPTALTAQSTTGVTGVHAVPAEFVTEQLETLLADVRVDAVKIGMLANADIVAAVADAVEEYELPNVVVDPVMVAQSGDRLLAAEAVQALRSRLLPLAHIVTPNLPETADLLDEPEVHDLAAMADQATRLLELGPQRALVKGGHLSGQSSTDLLAVPGAAPDSLSAERVATRNTHGTGCTLSSAIASLLPQRPTVHEAVRDAKDYLTQALRRADELNVGRGRGPVQHFHAWWPEPEDSR